MDSKTISTTYQQIVEAYQGRKKKHVVVRLNQREHTSLTEYAAGRSASVALEEIVSNYLKTMKRPQQLEKSVKKGSFVMSATLVETLQTIASETNTTLSAVIHAALRDAFPPADDEQKSKPVSE